jgi:hypothetical protein
MVLLRQLKDTYGVPDAPISVKFFQKYPILSYVLRGRNNNASDYGPGLKQAGKFRMKARLREIGATMVGIVQEMGPAKVLEAS